MSNPKLNQLASQLASQLLISTDLDGTLIDHHDYSWAAAGPAIKACQDLNIPIIFNTSKNYAEAKLLQERIGITGPMIVENGSAIVFDKADSALLDLMHSEKYFFETDSYAALRFGVQRTQILDFIEHVRAKHDWSFEGFNDWSVAQIIEQTSLTSEAAELASQKQFSEPFIWHSSEDDLIEFIALAQANKLTVLRGGRFYHLQGETDKSVPLVWLRQLLAGKKLSGNKTIKLVCLGDNHNDVHMLNVADFPVCVKSPVADFPDLNTNAKVYYTNNTGPTGWNEAVQHILEVLL